MKFFLDSVDQGIGHVRISFVISIMGTVLIKLWYWLVWNRYSVVREVKRLELRIAELIERSEKR